MTQEDSQTETGEVLLAAFDLIARTSESTRAKTAETFLELLGARVRNPNTRSAYRVAWRSFLAFCSARHLELESVKAYHVGAWLDQHSGSRSTQRQHLAAVRLLFDSLMMRRVVEYNPAARARPPRLVRESPHTSVFEEAEIVAFLDSISSESLKDIRDKAIFSVLFYSWCRVSALQSDGHRLLRAWRGTCATGYNVSLGVAFDLCAGQTPLGVGQHSRRCDGRRHGEALLWNVAFFQRSLDWLVTTDWLEPAEQDSKTPSRGAAAWR
jgi:hypothetical protein